MSSVQNQIINRDSVKQTYRSDEPFAEQMRMVTERETALIKAKKESEFVQPYAHDNYDEMEYEYNPPNYSHYSYSPYVPAPFDLPTFPPWSDIARSYPPDAPVAPEIGAPAPYPPEGYPTGNPTIRIDISFPCFRAILACWTGDGCYCPGQKKCVDIICTFPVGKMRVSDFGTKRTAAGFRATYENGQLCITAPAGANKTIEVPITVSWTCNGVRQIEDVESQAWFDKCDDIDCCDDSGLGWDAGMPETIARSTSAALTITDSTGRGGPYTWSVSGTGFSLTDGLTDGLTNTLNANAASCGPADITVTGCGGTSIIYSVRSTTGTWAIQAAGTLWPYGIVASGTIEEKYKLIGAVYQCYYNYAYSLDPDGAAECAAAVAAAIAAARCCETQAYPAQACAQAITYDPGAAFEGGSWPIYVNNCSLYTPGPPAQYFHQVKGVFNLYDLYMWSC